MSYTPLTPEQYHKARDSFSHEQIIQMEERRKRTAMTVEPEGVEEDRGFFESLVKRPVERLLLEPGKRATEALVAALPMVPKDMRDAALDSAMEDLTIDVPFLGEFTAKGIEEGTQGEQLGQIAGESLESAAWLYAPTKAAQAPGVGFREGIKQAAQFGARTGAVGGGLFGAGESLQEGDSFGEVAEQTAIGAGAGAAGGAALGGTLGAAPAAAGFASKHGYDLAESAARTIVGAGKLATQPIRGAATTANRVATRGAQQISEAAQRRDAISKAPKHVAEAMKQGWEDSTINFVRTGSQADKIQRAKMLETAKKAMDDLTFMDQAKRLPGETIVKGPVRHLLDTAKRGSEQTKQVLDSLPNNRVDASDLYNTFLRDARRMGLDISGGDIVRLRGSRVPDADMPFYKDIFRELTPNRLGRTPLTYKQMDALRDRWFRSVRADQTFTEGVRGRSGYLTRVRALLTDKIDEAAGGSYREAQQQTAESLKGLSEFARFIGYRGRIEDIAEKDLRAGEAFLRVFGNAADRPMSTLQRLYDTAKKYGYQGDEDVLSQLKFADILESIYGQPSRAVGEQVAKTLALKGDAQQSIAQASREAVKWSKYAGTVNLLKKFGLLGKAQDDVLRAFENLIRGEAGLPPITRSVLPLEKSVSNITNQASREAENVRRRFGIDVTRPVQRVTEKIQEKFRR